MMRNLLLIFLISIFCSEYGLAQTSAQYDKIKKELKPITVYDTIAKYKNGAIKYKGSIAEFDTEEYTYFHKIGKFERFYRKGSLMRTSMYDSYGILLNEKFYDPDGGLFCEYELVDLDTKAVSKDEFLESGKHFSITSREKNYRYSFKLCTSYLYSEGLRRNGKKTGTWKYYDVHGNLKKEKEY